MEVVKSRKPKIKDFEKNCKSVIANEKALLWTRLSFIVIALKNVLKLFCKEHNIAAFFDRCDNNMSFELQFSKEKECCNGIFNFYSRKAYENLQNGRLNEQDKTKKKRKYGHIMTNGKDKYILSLVFVIVFAEFMDYVASIKLFDHLASNVIDSDSGRDNSNHNKSSRNGSSNNGNNNNNAKIKKYKVLFMRLVLKCLVCEKAKIQRRATEKFIFPQKTTDKVPSSIAHKLINKAVRLDNEQKKMYKKKYDQLSDKEKKETKEFGIILKGLIEQEFDSITSTHTGALFWETAGWHLKLFGDKDKELLKIFLDITCDLPKWKQWNKNGYAIMYGKNNPGDLDEDEDEDDMPSLSGFFNGNSGKNNKTRGDHRGVMKEEKMEDEDEDIAYKNNTPYKPVMKGERREFDSRGGRGKKRKYQIKQESANANSNSNLNSSYDYLPGWNEEAPPEKIRKMGGCKSKSKNKSKRKQNNIGEGAGKVELSDEKFNEAELEMRLFEKEMQLKHGDGRELNYGSSKHKQQSHRYQIPSINSINSINSISSLSSSPMSSTPSSTLMSSPSTSTALTALTGEPFPCMSSAMHQYPPIGTMEIPSRPQVELAGAGMEHMHIGAQMGIGGFEQLAGPANIFDSIQHQHQQQQYQRQELQALNQAMSQMPPLSPMGNAVQNMQSEQAIPNVLQLGSINWQTPQSASTDIHQNLESKIGFGNNCIGNNIPPALRAAPPSHQFGMEMGSGSTNISSSNWKPAYGATSFKTNTMNSSLSNANTLPPAQFDEVINASCQNTNVGDNSNNSNNSNNTGVCNETMGMNFDGFGSNAISDTIIGMTALNGTNVNGNNLIDGNYNIRRQMPSMFDNTDDYCSFDAFLSPPRRPPFGHLDFTLHTNGENISGSSNHIDNNDKKYNNDNYNNTNDEP